MKLLCIDWRSLELERLPCLAIIIQDQRWNVFETSRDCLNIENDLSISLIIPLPFLYWPVTQNLCSRAQDLWYSCFPQLYSVFCSFKSSSSSVSGLTLSLTFTLPCCYFAMSLYGPFSKCHEELPSSIVEIHFSSYFNSVIT